ncbi:MAG TPA: hypothetical protein PL051_02995 [Candidatus Saccharibacteria bacterium]|nr:hypothetical protein [Candidatus Saccharibacteria bacterium]
MKRRLRAVGRTLQPALYSLTPHHLVGRNAKRKQLELFADKVGMVYFGGVSQQSDEHHIVRGLTVSNKHHDDHYCVGTYRTYDVIFVERTDTILTNHTHTWHIFEIDLKSTSDVPHMFIGSGTHGLGFHSLLKAKYPTLTPAPLNTLAKYPDSFTHNFDLFVTPSHAIAAEQIIDTKVAELIGTHCKGLVFEITSDSVFVYSEKPHLSESLLETMLANGVWLANTVDETSRLI